MCRTVDHRNATVGVELLSELTRSALARGSGAARQRAARARGELPAVVDALLAETRATRRRLDSGASVGEAALCGLGAR